MWDKEFKMNINYKTYKGRGRPRQKDYQPTFWQKWGNTIIWFVVFNFTVIMWFGGAVKAHKAYAESKRPFLNPIPVEQPKWNYTFIDEPIHKKKPTIEDLFYQYDWNAEVMIAICKSEIGFEYQGWKVDAQFRGNSDGSVDTGICMINSIHGYDTELLKTAEYNIQKAYEVYKRQGLKAWTKYNDKGYLVYMEETQ